MKRCKICGELKPLEDFYRSPGARDGFRLECKKCNLAARAAKYRENPRPTIERVMRWQRANREQYQARQREYVESGKKSISNRKSHLKRKYGLTLAEFDTLLASQGGGCAICGLPDADNVDHDHDTGRVRGILCFPCNVAVGLLHDSEERARSAAAYISRDDELDAVARERTGALSG